jgi:hypothetical protein
VLPMAIAYLQHVVRGTGGKTEFLSLELGDQSPHCSKIPSTRLLEHW